MCHLLLTWFICFNIWLYADSAEKDFNINIEDLKKIVQPKALQTRVVGGEVTTNEKLGGYLVALRYESEFICGGTLIKEEIVITAAHCFLGRSDTKKWFIDGGISTLQEKGVRVQLKDVKTPSSFREGDMHMDIAVVLLSKPLKGKGIQTIKLCQKRLPAGETLTVSGWGLTDPKATAPHIQLRTVNVPIIQKKECKRTYRSSVTLTESMFCAGILGQKDACTFDSGGPLVYKTRELCGVVSFGIGCASKKYPGVYTDINYVKPFIERSIQTLLKD